MQDRHHADDPTGDAITACLEDDQGTEAGAGAAIALAANRPIRLNVTGEADHVTRWLLPDGHVETYEARPGFLCRTLHRLADVAHACYGLADPSLAELYIGRDAVVLFPNIDEPREHYRLPLPFSEELGVLMGVPPVKIPAQPLDYGWTCSLTPFAFETQLRTRLRHTLPDGLRDALRHAVQSLARKNTTGAAAHADRNVDRISTDAEQAFTHDLKDDATEPVFECRLYALPELRERSALRVILQPDKDAREVAWSLCVTSEAAGQFLFDQASKIVKAMFGSAEPPVTVRYGAMGPAPTWRPRH